MTTTVAIRTRSAHPTVWLEMSYQGLDAPTGFFADLELVGWIPPTPAPPPHDAIDWSRPDEATGERFTIRDYRIEGAVAQPPAGTGPRGAWTDAERTTHLASLARVLDRHATIEVDDPAGLVRPAPVSALPPPPVAATVATSAPTAVEPTAVDAAAFSPSPDAAAVLVTAPIKPSLGPAIEDALVAMGVTAAFDNRDRIKRERYRASFYETTVTELHVAAVVAPSQLDAVVGVLRGHGLTLTFAEVDDAAVAPDPVPDPSTPAGAIAARDLVRVVVLADPRARDSIAATVRSLGLVEVSLTPATRTEISTYRGSRSEQEVPALRVRVVVPEPDAPLVARQLAAASHVRVDDASRVWIEPPAAADAPDGPSATTAAAAPVDDRVPSPTPPPPHRPATVPEPSGRLASPARLGRGVLSRRMSPVT